MVYEKRYVVPRRSSTFQIFPITNIRLSASLVLNCINFLFENFWFLIFCRKNSHWRKKFTRSILCNFGSSTAKFFFLANIPYSNCQINFQSSHLTKKETEDVSKRLSTYCMGALNSYRSINTANRYFCSKLDSESSWSSIIYNLFFIYFIPIELNQRRKV